MTDDWTQLSDSELRAKLEQRGITTAAPGYIDWLVRTRTVNADVIDRILGVER